jgi:hypothetical protein
MGLAIWSTSSSETSLAALWMKMEDARKEWAFAKGTSTLAKG